MPDSPTCLQPDRADTIGVSHRPLRFGHTVVMRDRRTMVLEPILNRPNPAVAWIGAGQTVTNNEFVPQQIGAVI